MRNLPAAVALLPALLIITPALAQSDDGASREPRRVRLGAGAQAVPSFPGADRVDIRPLVDVSVTRGEMPFAFEAVDESFGIPVVRGGGFAVGPVVNFEGNRSRRETGPGLDEVGFTVEAGGFAQYWVTPSLRFHTELRKGVTGHKAFIGNAGFDYVMRDGDRWLFAIGPRLTFSDAKYQDAYFRVSPREAAASGLPAFDPDKGGIHAAGLAASALYQLDERWGLYGFAKYDRLVGDAARSPIVRTIGSPDQFSGGLALTYTFRIRR